VSKCAADFNLGVNFNVKCWLKKQKSAKTKQKQAKNSGLWGYE